jgi:hypothetical protein
LGRQGGLGSVRVRGAGRLDLPTWEAKVRLVRRWLEDRIDRIVVLCDEPLEWQSTDVEDHHFAEHAESAATCLLADLRCRRVVTGKAPQWLWDTSPHHLDVVSGGAAWLTDDIEWGRLAGTAARVAEVCGDELERRSPLEGRLLVALAHWLEPAQLKGWWGSRPSRRD